MMASIAVAGNQWITEYLVQTLARDGWTPALLINLAPEAAAGVSGYRDLGALARARGIPLHRPRTYGLESDADRVALTGRTIDVLLVFGWQRLIPAWLLDHCARGAYGIHGGPEKPPRCRGRAVFNWAILLGCSRFYLYLFRLTPTADAGEIVDMTEFTITADDDIVSVYHKNCVLAGRLIARHLPSIVAGTVCGTPQPTSGATYLPRRKPEHGGIDWTAPVARVSNLVRAVAPPYPGAFTELDGMVVIIDRAHPFDRGITYAAEPGTIVEVFPNGHFLVQTGDGALYVRDYECPDRARVVAGRRFHVVSGVSVEDPAL
jgi:methionyl-tRNA formyltransferase